MKPIHFFYPDPDPSNKARPSDSRCRCATEIDAPAVPDTDRDDRRPDLGVLIGAFIAAMFWSGALAVVGQLGAVLGIWLCYALLVGVWYGMRRGPRRDKRAELSEAVRVGDVETVKRLTRELAGRN